MKSNYKYLPVAILMALQLSACGKAQVSPQQSETSAVVAEAEVPLIVTSSQTSTGLKVVLQQEKSLSASQSQKVRQAVSAVNQVINSAQFKDQVLNFTFQGTKQFAQNNGLTNEQIYLSIMGGAEKYPTQGAADGVADLYIAAYSPPWYRAFTSAVAFTNSSDKFEYIYNKYFNSASVSEIANTVIHEWTHRMGYSHDFNATAQRPYSVPYGIGGLIESDVKTYLGK